MVLNQQFDQYMREIDARINDLANKYGIDLGSSEDDTKNRIAADPEQQRNIKIAGILNGASEQEKTDTMLRFMNGEISMEYIPISAFDTKEQRNIKQAAIRVNREKLEVTLQTFMEFGGLI